MGMMVNRNDGRALWQWSGMVAALALGPGHRPRAGAAASGREPSASISGSLATDGSRGLSLALQLKALAHGHSGRAVKLCSAFDVLVRT